MLKIIRVKEFGLHRDSITTQYFALPWTLCYFKQSYKLIAVHGQPKWTNYNSLRLKLSTYLIDYQYNTYNVGPYVQLT